MGFFHKTAESLEKTGTLLSTKDVAKKEWEEMIIDLTKRKAAIIKLKETLNQVSEDANGINVTIKGIRRETSGMQIELDALEEYFKDTGFDDSLIRNRKKLGQAAEKHVKHRVLSKKEVAKFHDLARHIRVVETGYNEVNTLLNDMVRKMRSLKRKMKTLEK